MPFWGIAIILLLVGCDPVHTTNPNGGRFDKLVVASFDSINRHLILPRCLECHSGEDPPHGIDLSSYEKIVHGPVFPPLVVPGNPEASSFYTSMKSGEMPEKQASISPRALLAVYQWIKAGALNGSRGDSTDDSTDDPDEPVDEPNDPDEPIDDPADPDEPGDESEE